jgi:hypothetical protein
MLSHKKRFIIIHVYKVAGSSIRKVLHPDSAISFRQSSLKDKWISLSKGVKYSSDFDGHITALQLKNALPADIFNAYYKFGFVRNPWDWQVSLYNFGRKDKSHYQHDLFCSFKNFEEYLDWRVHNDLKLQKNFLVNEEGELLLDFVGRFENLQQDFNKICKEVNVPQVNLPLLNKSNNKRYQEFYDSKTIKLVGDAFKEDIEFSNYSYEY